MSQTVKRAIASVLNNAAAGKPPTDEDLAGMPSAAASHARTAANAVAALTANGDQRAAGAERSRLLRELDAALVDRGVDPNSRIVTRSSSSTEDIQALVDSIPPTA